MMMIATMAAVMAASMLVATLIALHQEAAQARHADATDRIQGFGWKPRR